MRGPYVNEDGDVWIERGAVKWPRAQAEARAMLDELGWGPADGCFMRYEGIQSDVRVSDEHEYVHGDDDGCADSQGKSYDDPTFVPCCRTTTAYHFRGHER